MKIALSRVMWISSSAVESPGLSIARSSPSCPETGFHRKVRESEVIYGYVTAASTPQEEPYGYVFHECKLESDCPPNSIYLGRPWREWAKTVFLHCELGEHIHPTGWQDWKSPTTTSTTENTTPTARCLPATRSTSPTN